MLDYYELLGSTDGTGAPDLRRAYRERIRALHPDRFHDDPAGLAMAGQMSILLNQAWATLRSPESRATYDSELQRSGHRPRTPPGPPPPGASGPAGARTDNTSTDSTSSGGTRTAGGTHAAGGHGTEGRAFSEGTASADDLLLDALVAAQQHVAVTENLRHERGELAELAAPLLSAGRRYRSRFESAGDEPATVAAMAIAAAARDVLDGVRAGDPKRARLTRAIVEEAVRVLAGPIGLDSASWLEHGIEPAQGASRRWRQVRVLSWLAVLLAVAGVAAAAVVLGSWAGLTSLPFFADYYGPAGSAAALGSAPGCLTLWLAARVRQRWFATVGGAAVPARPTQTLHLDAVDRVRFEAGRRFTTLPDTPPGVSPRS